MTDRRTFIGMAGAALLSPLLHAGATAMAPGSLLPLWTQPPGGGGPTGPIHVDAGETITNIAMPSIEPVLPARPNGRAVLVAGGGGYTRISLGNESRPAAHWLAARGITAFILRYRLPGEGWTVGPLAPLQDAQRAMRLIRANAARFGIDPAKVGALGFSAGGHLMGLAATRAAFASYRPVDAADTQPARPDAAALIYPVITLEPPYDDTSSRRVLVGKDPSRALSAEWSVQTHVHAGCPPVFLVHAIDDPIARPANDAIMVAACRRAGVPVASHALPSGGHGFGMGKPGSPTSEWPAWYGAWLARLPA